MKKVYESVLRILVLLVLLCRPRLIADWFEKRRVGDFYFKRETNQDRVVT